MTDRQDQDDALETLFAQARAARPEPGPDLLSRIMADAAGLQEERRPDARPMRSGTPRTPGLWRWLSELLGGWPALSGLAAATVAGVWIGATGPGAVGDIAMNMLGETVSVDLIPDTDPFGLEG